MATGSHIRRNVHGYRLSGSPYLDLRSPGLFASWPGIGLTMIVLGSILFVTLAYGISMANGPVLQWDLAATQAIHAQLKNIPASLVEYVLFGFFIGKEIVIAIGVILTIYLLYKRFWRELALVLVGLGGGTLLWYFLNQYFDRPRPSGQMAVLPLTDPSFPEAGLPWLPCFATAFWSICWFPESHHEPYGGLFPSHFYWSSYWLV